MVLAETDICGIPVVVILIGLWIWYIYQNASKYLTEISWSGSFWATIDIPDLQELAKLIFCEYRQCSMSQRTDWQQVFLRGDRAIKELPLARDVAWFEFPVTISLTYSRRGQRTDVDMHFTAPRDMRFNRDCASTFHTNAEEERDLFFQAVQWVIEHPDEWSNENPGRETCTSQAKENSQDSANDYETLGIQADSSWSDVQAAYREICRKYHPDTLSGYKVPPHITELAIQRFKQATEAYRRLKSRIGVAD